MSYEVLTVGNAVIDILVNVEEEFIGENGLDKSAMKLVDREESDLLYSKVGEATEKSGGSAANTAVGFGKLKGSAAYIGTIAKDQFGKIFKHDMDASGVAYEPIYVQGKPTSSSLILVTPDGERTMNTYLGASLELGPEHIDANIIKAAKTIYFEGYLWYQPPARAAFDHIVDLVKDSDTKISVSLADQFCVENFHDDFSNLVNTGVIDILFGNKDEFLALYKTDNLDEALEANAKTGVLTFITLGADGAVAQKGAEKAFASVDPVSNIVDLTGAGDMFASGVLFGLSKNLPIGDCASLGCMVAREVIQHMGPHPKDDILDVIKGKFDI